MMKANQTIVAVESSPRAGQRQDDRAERRSDEPYEVEEAHDDHLAGASGAVERQHHVEGGHAQGSEPRSQLWRAESDPLEAMPWQLAEIRALPEASEPPR